MTYEEEIKDLIEQKKLIEMRIRELREKSKSIGVAKIDQYDNALKYYYVAVKRIALDGIVNYRPQYNPIIVAKEKYNAIKQIPKVIEDLQKLYYCSVCNMALEGDDDG